MWYATPCFGYGLPALAAVLMLGVATTPKVPPGEPTPPSKPAPHGALTPATKVTPPSAPTPSETAASRTTAASRVKKKGALVKAKPLSVVLFHVNTKESLRVRYDAKGRLPKGFERRVDRFFRCHHTRKQGRISPRLVRQLFLVGQRYPGKRVEVVSGFRDPRVAKNPRSPHMKGLACDFRVRGVKNTELRDYLRRLRHVGVGFYPNSSFVHLDVRRGASVFWIDYSGPGEGAFYSETPGDDLRSGRADQFKPTRIDPTWVEETSAEHDGASEGKAAVGGQASAEVVKTGRSSP